MIVIDFGVKQNILRMLADRNFNVIVVPLNISYENILKLNPDGIFSLMDLEIQKLQVL